MSWHFVERWLEKASQHATLVGKFWLTFLIVCRMVIIASIGDRVYADEQSEFKCNTQQPGCNNVCFNSFSPISHLRFWSFQILACAMPSIIFVIYSGHKAREKSKLESEAKKRQKERAQRHQERGPTQASAPFSTSGGENRIKSPSNLKDTATQTNQSDIVEDVNDDVRGSTLKRQRRTPRRGGKGSSGKPSEPGAGSDGESDSDNENSPLTTQQQQNTVLDIDKRSTAASLPPLSGCGVKSVGSTGPPENVLVWLPSQPPNQVKHRKGNQPSTHGQNGHLPNDLMPIELPPYSNEYLQNADDFTKQHIHTAPITHRDPEITKIIKKPNRHFRLYVVSTFVRLNLEFGFLYLQWHLFGFEVPSTYKCRQSPCPNVVDCFPSRPQEKTIFLYFMFLFSILCCVLNVCEFLELIWKLLKRCDCQRLNCCGCQQKYQRPSEASRQYLQAGPPPAPFIFDGPSVSRLEGNYDDGHYDNRPLLGDKRHRFVKRSASGLKSPTSSAAQEKLLQDKGYRRKAPKLP
ncbi:Oidioi.mRNA.OKI2018_I69.chr2.g7557.t2.cds [Oikopleura dioica]|uniref:Oidioi.mRNA.OKI2018_I69.chr2.g7557.t2.cds n=1 Tax=Oikopleura dioica TaxID=34765 RepID=A0ABN7TA20_OIKDI|nr:Oidioi.mRNA.OKI2018_I69.chr2.g7557.t2.cds [Oikopleura dioica]